MSIGRLEKVGITSFMKIILKNNNEIPTWLKIIIQN